MIQFIVQNLANIIISAVIAAIVVLISINLVKKKKSGKPIACSSGCAGCPSAGMCHQRMESPVRVKSE
jgi:hypothetical protein